MKSLCLDSIVRLTTPQELIVQNNLKVTQINSGNIQVDLVEKCDSLYISIKINEEPFQELQLITQSSPFQNSNILFNDFSTQIVISIYTIKQLSYLFTLDRLNTFEHEMPEQLKLNEIIDKPDFKQDQFVITSHYVHTGFVLAKCYVQQCNYIACFAKIDNIKSTQQEQHVMETQQDINWCPSSYMRDPDDYSFYKQVFSADHDLQYVKNKTREVAGIFIWLLEPWVLKNPHELIQLTQFIPESFIVELNSTSLIVYSGQFLQIYQQSSFIWTLSSEVIVESPIYQLEVCNNDQFKILSTANYLYCYKQFVRPCHKQYLSRTQDRLLCLTDIHQELVPFPMYSLAIHSDTPVKLLINHYILDTDNLVILLVFNVLTKSFSLEQYHFSKSEIQMDEETQELAGFTGENEQEIINEQERINQQTDLQNKIKQLQIDYENGYEVLQNCQDLFTNEYQARFFKQFSFKFKQSIDISAQFCDILEGTGFLVLINDQQITIMNLQSFFLDTIQKIHINLIDLIDYSHIAIFTSVSVLKLKDGFESCGQPFSHNIFDHFHKLHYNQKILCTNQSSVCVSQLSSLLTNEQFIVVIDTNELKIFDKQLLLLYCCLIEDNMSIISIDEKLLHIVLFSQNGYFQEHQPSVSFFNRVLDLFNKQEDNSFQILNLLKQARFSISSVIYQKIKNNQKVGVHDFQKLQQLINCDNKQLVGDTLDLFINPFNIYQANETPMIPDYLQFDCQIDLIISLFLITNSNNFSIFIELISQVSLINNMTDYFLKGQNMNLLLNLYKTLQPKQLSQVFEVSTVDIQHRLKLANIFVSNFCTMYYGPKNQQGYYQTMLSFLGEIQLDPTQMNKIFSFAMLFGENIEDIYQYFNAKYGNQIGVSEQLIIDRLYVEKQKQNQNQVVKALFFVITQLEKQCGNPLNWQGQQVTFQDSLLLQSINQLVQLLRNTSIDIINFNMKELTVAWLVDIEQHNKFNRLVQEIMDNLEQKEILDSLLMEMLKQSKNITFLESSKNPVIQFLNGQGIYADLLQTGGLPNFELIAQKLSIQNREEVLFLNQLYMQVTGKENLKSNTATYQTIISQIISQQQQVIEQCKQLIEQLSINRQKYIEAKGKITKISDQDSQLRKFQLQIEASESKIEAAEQLLKIFASNQQLNEIMMLSYVV